MHFTSVRIDRHVSARVRKRHRRPWYQRIFNRYHCVDFVVDKKNYGCWLILLKNWFSGAVSLEMLEKTRWKLLHKRTKNVTSVKLVDVFIPRMVSVVTQALNDLGT